MKNESTIRKSAVAGMFYPANPNALSEQIADLRRNEITKIREELATPKIFGGVVPHAGYIYSGYEAVHFFELVRLSKIAFDTVVILNPDHQGYSPEYATCPHDKWETPLGTLLIDKEMSEYFPKSEIAHRDEHSAEVMLPFIQTFFEPHVKIVPISIGKPTPETAKKIANRINQAVRETGRKILIIASSDFSHYVTPENGIMLDNRVLERIENLDSEGVFQTVKQFGVTVCGYGPIMTLIEYSLLINNNPKVDIAVRGNSGKKSPSKSVVDYITLIFSAQ